MCNICKGNSFYHIDNTSNPNIINHSLKQGLRKIR
nr:MAG TPA: hypothetical protein [Caudoviricetes sp.]